MNKICKFDKCKKPARSRGYCSGHYEQFRLGRDMKALVPRVPSGTWKGVEKCSIEGCERKMKARGMCGTHLWQVDQSKSGVPGVVREINPGNWGEWRPTKAGYLSRTRYLGNKKSERQFQHRYVAEQHLGRKLLPGENVHHINGDRADNRIGNLEIWTTSQPAGQRVGDKIAWAKEFLEQYGYTVTHAMLDT